MTESEVEFRDISLENVTQQSSGVVGASILTGLFLCLFVLARRRDNSLAQQRAKLKRMVCMKSRIFGSQLVPEGNCQYKIITDSSKDQLDKIWHIFKLRIKHKHRWVSVFTRTENTRFQTRERVLVLYVYMLSVFAFAAIFHGQKARVAGVADAGILSSLFSILPTFCVAQLFKNSRSEDPSRNVQRKKSLRDYDNDSVDSNAQNEYGSNKWNARTSDQKTTNCGMFFATLCGGHLDSEDTLEHSSQNAFSPVVNLFTYFAALAWSMECVVLIIAFTIQFDLIHIEMPEATAWGLSILVAALWDFLIDQPAILLVQSMATVFTAKMFKGDFKNGHEDQNRPPVRKKSSRKKERRGKKEARKELTVIIGSTRGRKEMQDDHEIKTEPVTLGRTKGGGMREMRMSDASPRGSTAEGRSQNFLIDGETDTKRLHSSVHKQGQVGLGTPSSSNTFVTTSSSVPEVSPLPASPSEASTHPHPPTFQPSPDLYGSAIETPETSDSEESAASHQSHLVDIPTSTSTIASLEVVPNVTHPHQTIRGRKLKSPSFVAAMDYHKKKRNSIQPPNPSFLSGSTSLSGIYQQDDDPTDV